MGLTPFEDRDVVGTAIAVTNAGDGLSAAMKIQPAELHLGDTVYIVLETTVTKVRHEPADKNEPDGEVVRMHVLRAGTAVIVERKLVGKLLDAQAARIRKAAEDEAGILHLAGTDSEADDA
jgi:hypothetical protein